MHSYCSLIIQYVYYYIQQGSLLRRRFLALDIFSVHYNNIKDKKLI